MKEFIFMATSKKEAVQLAGEAFQYVGIYKRERNPIPGRGNHFYSFKEKGPSKLYEAGKFTLDGDNVFRGYESVGTEWNGFSCPSFEFRTVVKILKSIGATNVNFSGNDLIFKAREETEFTTVSAEVIRVLSNSNNSVGWLTLYPLGAYCWTWQKKGAGR